MSDDRLCDWQIHIATAAVKRHQPELFANDPVYGESGLWRHHTPAMQAAMELVLVPGGYEDPTMPFRAMAGVAVMAYLCGMYALLYRQCRTWSIPVLVAVLSCAVVATPGGSLWGIGSLASVTPAGLCLAISPLILLAFLRYQRRWQLLLVFGFVGLLGNLHLASATNLALVLLIAYLGRRRFALRAWPMAIGCAAMAVAAGTPYLFYFLSLRRSLGPAGAAASYTAAYQALKGLEVLYPDLLKSLLEWDLLIRVLVLAVAAAVVLLRVERFRVRSIGLWVWLVAASVLVAYGLQGASQLIGWLRHTAPPVIDFVQASALVMLPLYVLFAQALTNLFRLSGRHRKSLRWACAVMLAAWLLPTDNLRIARHAVYDGYDAIMRRTEKAEEPRTVRRHQLQQARHAELAVIAQWARTQSDQKAAFIIDRADFRMMARRAIVASDEDARAFYYMSPSRLEAWDEQVTREKALLKGPIDPESLRRFVADLSGSEEWEGVPAWYVVVTAGVAPGDGAMMREVLSPGWGRHYRLYRLP